MSTVLIHPTARLARTAARPAASRADADLRLTRRGRLTLFVTAALVATGAAVSFSSSVIATSEAGAPVAATTVTVQPGETLWQLAQTANPGGDVRQTVDDIMELNSLPAAGALQIGDDIALPDYR